MHITSLATLILHILFMAFDNYPSMENQTFLRAHFMMMMMMSIVEWEGIAGKHLR